MIGTALAATVIALSPLQVCQGGGLEPSPDPAHQHLVCKPDPESGLNACDWYWNEDPTGTSYCYEDEPCFDCRTMGNQICGPNNLQGVPAGYYGLGDCTNVAGFFAQADRPATTASTLWELMLETDH